MTVYWEWDCETMASDSPNLLVGTLTGASELSTDTAHGGSKSMKITVTGDGGNESLGAQGEINQNNSLQDSVGGGSIYHRFWMRMNTGFSWGSADRKTKASRCGASSLAPGYTGYLTGSGCHIGEAQQGSPSEDPVAGSMISYSWPADSTWHEYIIRVQYNSTNSSTDAIIALWADGVQIEQLTDFRIANAPDGQYGEWWGTWMVAPYFQLNDLGQGGIIYLDDFKIATTFAEVSSFEGGGGSVLGEAEVVLGGSRVRVRLT